MFSVEFECRVIMIEFRSFPVICCMALCAVGFTVPAELVKVPVGMAGGAVRLQSGKFLMFIASHILLKMTGFAPGGAVHTR